LQGPGAPAPYADLVIRRPVSQRLTLLVAVGIIAGVLMAGMLLPFVGGIGLAARSASNDFDNLPTDLKQPPLPQVSKVVAADGSTLATFYDQDRVVVPLKQVPQSMQTAIIAIEDVRFYEHNGVDLKGTLRALLHNGSSGQVSQGGSTLTQQYVKNVLIEDAHTKAQREAAIADTLGRKVREAKLALGLEHKLTKEQILERYLNIAYFGDGAYGVGTAARHYFDEPVSKLTLAQSAMLAGLVQSPDAYDPRLHPVAARERRDTVLDQMLKYHFIQQSAYDQASSSSVRLHIHRQLNDCIASQYPYFCDYVKHVFETTPGLGLSKLRRGGLTVTTTLDPKVQAAAQAGIHDYVHQHEPAKVASAEAVVQPGTGEVKAIAVSTKYGNNPKKGENSYDYAVDRKMGGGPSGFRAGSTFKLFVLAAALKEGIPLDTTIRAPGEIKLSGFTDCAGHQVGSFEPHNDEPGSGQTYNLRTGTWFSVNTFFAQLEKRTGLCQPVKLAEAMGMRSERGGPIGDQNPSFVLGSGNKYGFSPMDLANAYATVAAHGKYCHPVVITKIVDSSGRSYPVPKPDCEQVLDQGLADTITSILQGVLTVRGATGTEDNLTARPAAAKTGTVDNYEGSWFAGYTPQLASAVWAGVPARPNTSLTGLTFGGRYYGGPVFGATVAGRIWQATFNAALQGKPAEEFNGPDLTYTRGTTSSVPDVSGLSPGTAEKTLTQAGFNPQLESGAIASTEPAGVVAGSSPRAGDQASAGTTVEIYLSSGTPPAPPPATTSPKPGKKSNGNGGGKSSGGTHPPSAPPPPAHRNKGHH
jgi:membrane peptidoglycan carboxypeptidase